MRWIWSDDEPSVSHGESNLCGETLVRLILSHSSKWKNMWKWQRPTWFQDVYHIWSPNNIVWMGTCGWCPWSYMLSEPFTCLFHTPTHIHLSTHWGCYLLAWGFHLHDRKRDDFIPPRHTSLWLCAQLFPCGLTVMRLPSLSHNIWLKDECGLKMQILCINCGRQIITHNRNNFFLLWERHLKR